MEYAPSNRKRLPYGMMNFADIRFDNYYYVDKTAFIPLIEQSDRFFFFIRPRRFGKSLTLSIDPFTGMYTFTGKGDCVFRGIGQES